MLTFLLQLDRLFVFHEVTLYMAMILLVWAVWGMKAYFSTKYRPFTGDFGGLASVIIPVVDEPAELFLDVLTRIQKQNPHEIIVVINGKPNPVLSGICDELGITWEHTAIPGKRNAVKIGVERSTGDITVLVDSDTLWSETTLEELLRPFTEATVGGVTTNQRILDPNRNMLTRWADWMESIRSEYSMPAMSYHGTVGCLPGRTIAFRRKIIVDNMTRFMSEKFLGVFLEVSDDRTLTNFALQDGYRTVFQSTSLVFTDAPTDLRTLIKQQHRWARGSQYNTLRMLGWMIRKAPVLAVYYIADIVIPFMVAGCIAGWAVSAALPTGHDLFANFFVKASGGGLIVIIAMAVFLTAGSIVLRYSRHFSRRGQDIKWVPVFMLLNTFLLVPIRVHGFFVCAVNAGWGTRRGAYTGEKTRRLGSLVPAAIGTALTVATMSVVVLQNQQLLA